MADVKLLPVPQAFFDEFGAGADDRVQDYAHACIAAIAEASFKWSDDAGNHMVRGDKASVEAVKNAALFAALHTIAMKEATPPAGAGEAVPFESMRAKRVNVHDASLGWVAHTPRCEHRFDKDQANVWNAALASAATATLAAPTPLPEAVRELVGKWRARAGGLAHRGMATHVESCADELDRALTGEKK